MRNKLQSRIRVSLWAWDRTKKAPFGHANWGKHCLPNLAFIRYYHREIQDTTLLRYQELNIKLMEKLLLMHLMEHIYQSKELQTVLEDNLRIDVKYFMPYLSYWVKGFTVCNVMLKEGIFLARIACYFLLNLKWKFDGNMVVNTWVGNTFWILLSNPIRQTWAFPIALP